MSRLPLTTRGWHETIAWRGSTGVSVRRFLAEADGLARRLPDRGYAINLCRDRYRFARAFAATLMAGQTNLLPGNRLEATIRDLLATYPGAYVLSDEDCDHHWSVHHDARVFGDDIVAPPAIPQVPAQHCAALVFTSGSTGQAKAIAKPWRTFHDSTAINAAEMGLTEQPTRQMVATVPAQHMYGLETSVLVPLFAPVAASSSHPFTPADIAAALAALPTPRVLVSSPAHLRALMDPGIEFPPLEAVWSATGPLDPAIAARIEQRHDTRVSEIYGCSEAGSMARREPVRSPAWSLFRGFTLRTEDDGRTRVTAPHLPASFVLQDVLEHEPDGRFHLVGRTEDLVNVAGKRTSLVDLNRALLQIPGVEDGAIFGPPERGDGRTSRLAALVVAPELDAATLKAELRKRVDAVFVPRPIRWTDALPRAETGKLPRKELLDAYAQASPARGDESEPE